MAFIPQFLAQTVLPKFRIFEVPLQSISRWQVILMLLAFVHATLNKTHVQKVTQPRKLIFHLGKHFLLACNEHGLLTTPSENNMQRHQLPTCKRHCALQQVALPFKLQYCPLPTVTSYHWAATFLKIIRGCMQLLDVCFVNNQTFAFRK